MLALLPLILPLFLLIAAGYAATFTKVFDAAAARALSAFVFYFAIPIMLFRSMASMDPPGSGTSGLLVTFYGAMLAVLALGAISMRLVFTTSWREAAMLGFAGAYGNTVMIGIPVVLTVLGEAAGLPLFLIISLHSVVMFTTVTLVMETTGGAGASLRELPLQIAKGVFANPIIIGLVLGLALNHLGWPLPAVVDGFAALVGQAAIPCALFATGAALRQFSIGSALPKAALLVVIKGIVHPALVFALCLYVLSLPPLWAAVAVVLAATPVGVNPYLFAVRYGTAEGATATAIALSTPFSIFSITVALWALGAV
ncbi:MAG: AEC family transporter [Geminicoccaceae bacterium]|nr:MAG: AEC family transporter [Geminicoccaceae bacterium]